MDSLVEKERNNQKMSYHRFVTLADYIIVVIAIVALASITAFSLIFGLATNVTSEDYTQPPLKPISEAHTGVLKPEILLFAIPDRPEKSLPETPSIEPEEEVERLPADLSLLNGDRSACDPYAVMNEVAILELYKEELPYLQKCVYGEYRGPNDCEMAAVVWCILNRVDSTERYFPNTIVEVITQSEQFHGYKEDNPTDDAHIKDIVIDVLIRWEREKMGCENSGRVLPKEYCWFWGDAFHNYFRDTHRGDTFWDWSLPNPYGT